MRKYAVALATLGIAAVGFAGPAQAGERTGGTPGAPNCFGQNTAWAAQHGQKTLRPEGYTGRINGIAGFARGYSTEEGYDVSVRELLAVAESLCSE